MFLAINKEKEILKWKKKTNFEGKNTIVEFKYSLERLKS